MQTRTARSGKERTNHEVTAPPHALKNRSAMRTRGIMLNFIPFGWNAVLKYQYLGAELLQVKR